MEYRVIVLKKAEKQFARLPREYQDRIIKAIAFLATSPFSGKKLEAQLLGLYSIRVWPYRIIYEVYEHDLIVSVIKVEHRQGVYKI